MSTPAAICAPRAVKTQRPDLLGVAPATRAPVDICLMGALTESPRLAVASTGHQWLTVMLLQPGDCLSFVASIRAEPGDMVTLVAIARKMAIGTPVLVRGSGITLVSGPRLLLTECRLIRAVRIDPAEGLVFL